MPRIPFFVICTLASTLVLAQDWAGVGRLEGRVTDTDGKPVGGAAVKLDQPARGGGPTVNTDKKGRWAYLGLAAGSWNVDVSAPGYVPRKISVTLASEGARVPPIEVKLEKAAAAGPPPDVVAAFSAAEDAYKAERYEEAIAEYGKLLALRPDLASTIHQQIGFAHIRLRRYEPALTHLQQVLDADPSKVQIRAIAAQAAIEGGMLDRGLELLKGLDEAKVMSPDLFFNIGVNFLNANEPAQAITYFGKAIAADPAYADGYFRRALAYVQTGKIPEAKADLRKLLELTPEGAQAEAARKTLAQLP